MIEITEFGHINIVVSDVDEATEFYHSLFGFELVQYFKNFKNPGFAKSAGFLDHPDDVLLDINFLKIPQTKIYIELISYIQPASGKQVEKFSPNDLGGPRHIALRIKNIDAAYEKVKFFPGVTLISTHDDYRPYRLDKVHPNDFSFSDKILESDTAMKIKAAEVSSSISFFYFTDKFGVTWELEEEPTGIDDPALSI
ncbi:methylmalonyl-CoA epimerase [Serratia plymuthica]|uniref:VOC family protein n=1 Tax=Serratia plymuthica TaxID=82996 RepID=UPI00217919DA|nr:VOC family protein [Serratia plymuthica]CAI1214993.1 methylmalonyl-CoA epimerase [Serratia plymuthica]